MLFLVLVMGLSAGAALGAPTPITVVNYSFELPGTSKQSCWDGEKTGSTDVPGWTDGDVVASNSGVETSTTTHGSWIAFLMGGDTSVWNLTNRVIAAGDVYELKVDARSTSGASTIRYALYYDDAGTRVTVATNDVSVTGTMQTFSLSFVANSVPASIGKKIGIELDNPASGWAGFDNVRLSLLTEASNPEPPNGSIYTSTTVVLTWATGCYAAKHDVYFGDNLNDVNNASTSTPSIYKGRQSEAQYPKTSPPPMTVERGKTYYWRIDEVNDLHPDRLWRGSIWSFTVLPTTAWNPSPSDGATFVDPCGVLSWSAGGTAGDHYIYFGTNFNDVNNVPVGDTTSPLYMGYTTEPMRTWDPCGVLPLALLGKTYYWRIDEEGV
jgi:hypothetical protein